MHHLPRAPEGEHGGKLEQLSKVLNTVEAGGKAAREECYSEAENKEKECTAKAVGRGRNKPTGSRKSVSLRSFDLLGNVHKWSAQIRVTGAHLMETKSKKKNRR